MCRSARDARGRDALRAMITTMTRQFTARSIRSWVTASNSSTVKTPPGTYIAVPSTRLAINGSSWRFAMTTPTARSTGSGSSVGAKNTIGMPLMSRNAHKPSTSMVGPWSASPLFRVRNHGPTFGSKPGVHHWRRLYRKRIANRFVNKLLAGKVAVVTRAASGSDSGGRAARCCSSSWRMCPFERAQHSCRHLDGGARQCANTRRAVRRPNRLRNLIAAGGDPPHTRPDRIGNVSGCSPVTDELKR